MEPREQLFNHFKNKLNITRFYGVLIHIAIIEK